MTSLVTVMEMQHNKTYFDYLHAVHGFECDHSKL